MIKVTLGDEKPPHDYPCIKIARVTQRIVLFTERGVGICLSYKEYPSDVGHFRNSWAEDEFDLYPGPITLKNE